MGLSIWGFRCLDVGPHLALNNYLIGGMGLDALGFEVTALRHAHFFIDT